MGNNSVIQVLASKTKIYMILEFVNGGELFDAIVSTNQHTIVALPYDLHDK